MRPSKDEYGDVDGDDDDDVEDGHSVALPAKVAGSESIFNMKDTD